MIRFLILSLLLLMSASVSAAPKVKAKPQVKALYRAGAQAYEQGKFEAAIEAFETAYGIQPLPQLLFSAAAAHRRQYAADGGVQHLHTALANYRKYLAEVKTGGRRVDAAKAIETLQSKVREDDEPTDGEKKAKATRLMVTTTSKTATLALDDKAAVAMPFVEQVEPGPHVLLIKAPGYRDVRREVVAVEGAVVAIEVPLAELPAQLMVNSSRGGDLLVDGSAHGSLPLPSPIKLPAGARNVVVLSRGSEAFVQAVTLERGKTFSLDVVTTTTKQRTTSYAVMGTSVAGFIAGGVLGGLAHKQQSTAQGILDARTAGSQRTEADRLDYNAAIAARDDLRTSATVALGSAAAVGVAGFLLYLLDVPTAPRLTPAANATNDTPKPQEDRTEIELSYSGVTLRF